MRSKLYLLPFLLISFNAFSQKNGILFTDFDIFSLAPINQIQKADSNTRKYIRCYFGAHNKLNRIVVIDTDGIHAEKRIAYVTRELYGTLFAFKVLKTAGYEKVIIFADKNYQYDSIVIRNDTIFCKQWDTEGHGGSVDIRMLYFKANDTLVIKTYRDSYRYPEHVVQQKWTSLKNSHNWLKEIEGLEETLTLVKENSRYRIVTMETHSEEKEKDLTEYLNRKQQTIEESGESLFWITFYKWIVW